MCSTPCSKLNFAIEKIFKLKQLFCFRPSSKTQGDRKSHDERRKKAEHTKSMQKHDSRHWKMKTPTRYFTNLTVPRETDHSKVSGKVQSAFEFNLA